jgi:cytoskeleton protein RodZ
MSEAVGPPASEDMAPGPLLARLRAERKLSVADVAQRLKYAVRQIEALEAEEFSRLPGTTFVRGMIRGYAKLLEIDAEPLLRSLDRRQIPGAATVDLRAKRVPFPDGTRRRGTRVYAILSVLVLAAVGGVLYEWHWGGGLRALPGMGRTEVAQAPAEAAPPEPAQPAAARVEPAARVQPAAVEKPAAQPRPEIPKTATSLPKAAPSVPKAASAAPKPAAAVPASSPAAPLKDVKTIAGQGRIFMEFADDSWVEIKDSEGKMLMAQLNPGGSRRVVSGHPPFSLVIGNAAAVRVVYNDRPVDLVPHVKVEVARFSLP